MSLPAFALGAFTWTASEYVIHRFVGHGPRRERIPGWRGWVTPAGLAAAFNDEHLRHHADTTYFAPTRTKAIAAVGVTGFAALIGSAIVGPRRGISFALGFGATYVAYEVVHRRSHTHAPSNAYSHWVRKHHMFHHFKTPRLNHGVTSPLWDRLIGTEERLPAGQPLRVPRRHAPAWLVDTATDAVKAIYAADYELAGRAAGPAVATDAA